tara:strand:- start:159 stop:809 length:651 start_codon:yes stop_codon:yes gene_type:complete
MKIPKNWSFNNKEIADNFETHVKEQLPWYDLTTSAIRHIARHYIPKNGKVYDLGASIGNIGCSLQSILEERNCKFIAIEKEKEMINNYKCTYGDIIESDIKDYAYENFDVAIVFLTLMFVEPKFREKLLNKLYQKLNKGGAIIIFDKKEMDQGYFGLINYRLTLAEKVETTPYKDIIEKELSLQGIQRPLDVKILSEYNPKLFFKFSDFVGYILEK